MLYPRVAFLPFVALTFALLAAVNDARHLRKTGPKTYSTSASSKFCRAFTRECYREALAGTDYGHIEVTHMCHRNGGKYSTSYSFGCKKAGNDITSNVLAHIGDAYNVSSSGAGSTRVVTATTSDIDTVYSSVSGSTDATVFSDVTTTLSETYVDETTVGTVGTTVLTTVIPVTSTVKGSSTFTTTTDVTSIAATSMITSYLLGSDPVTILKVDVSGLARRGHRHSARASSSFCSAFQSACSTECSRVSSTPKHEVCEANGGTSYSLSCKCANGKHETQHALLEAVENVGANSVSTVGTTTSYATASGTTTIPTTIYKTHVATITSTVPVTKTYTSHSTATSTRFLTDYTGLSVTVGTETAPGTTETATSTISSTATSTTQIVLSPTGYIHAISQDDGSDLGVVGTNANTGLFTPTASDGIEFMAVYDADSQLYQMMLADGSGDAWISEAGFQGRDFEASSKSYTWNYAGSPSLCNPRNAVGAGPASGSGTYDGHRCETFVFAPAALDDTQGATDDTVNLRFNWTNPAGSADAVHQGQYVYYQENSLLSAANASLGGLSSYPVVTLRFPYSS